MNCSRFRPLIPLLILATLFLIGPGTLHAQPRHSQEGGDVIISNDDLVLKLFADSTYTLAASDGRDLLYPENTSYVTVRADGVEYVLLDPVTEGVSPPQQVSDDEIQQQFATPEGLTFTLSYRLAGPAVRFAVRVDNNGDRAQAAEVRYLLDTQIAGNDGSPLWSNGQVHTQELALAPPYGPFKGYDRFPDPDFSSYGLFQTAPERVMFVHWPTAYEVPWDYAADPNRDFSSDSAVLAFFNLGSVDPGGSAEAVFFYGLDAPSGDRPEQLLTELALTRNAFLARIDSDQQALVAIHRRALEVLYAQGNATAIVDQIIAAADLLSNERETVATIVDASAEGDTFPLSLAAAAYGQALQSLDDTTRQQVGRALLALYQDLAHDDPELQQRIAQIASDELTLAARRAEIQSSFTAYEDEIRSNGVPSSYPLAEVRAVLRQVRSQLQTTTRHEALLLWPNRDRGSAAFQVSGLLTSYREALVDADGRDSAATTASTLAFATRAGDRDDAPLLLVSCFISGCANGSVALVGQTTSDTAVAEPIAGPVGEISYDRFHADLAYRATLAAGSELDLLETAAADLIAAVRQADADRAAWQSGAEITGVTLGDIVVAADALVGTARGQVTVRNTGGAPYTVTTYGTLQAPVAGQRAVAAILGQPAATEIAPGAEATISFDFGSPDSRLWRSAARYSADLWVAAGQQLFHVTSDPRFAEMLSPLAGTTAANQAMVNAPAALVGSATLAANESNRHTVTVDGAVATLELAYPGSDFDLHLYDASGQHVGVDYNSGTVDRMITGVTYSGADVRPEWMHIVGQDGATFEVEVVAVQADAPLPYAVVSRVVPALPALLGADPTSFAFTADDADGAELVRSLSLYEYGGEEGITNLNATLAALQGDDGGTMPASAFRLVLPGTLEPGGAGSGTLTLDVDNPETDVYRGQIEISGQSAVSANPVSAVLPVTVHVTAASGPALWENTTLVAAIGGALVLLLALITFLVLRRRRAAAAPAAPPAAPIFPQQGPALPTERPAYRPPSAATPATEVEAPPTVKATQTCPHCGNPVRAGAKFCASCGQSLAAPQPRASRYCPHCGEEVRSDAKFCAHCGGELPQRRAAP
jgi:hypothetical protein